MSAARLLLLGALAAIVTALVAFPLRQALAWFAPLAPGFSTERVTGTVWSGVAEDARFGALRLGDVALRASPLAALSGAAGFRVSANGEASGEGGILIAPGRLKLEARAFAAPASVTPFPLPLAGQIRVEGLNAEFRDGACRAAVGKVSSDALAQGLAGLDWEGPALEGDVSCAEDGALLAALSGGDARAAVTLQLKLYGDGRFAIESRIAPTDASLAQALAAAGFPRSPEGFRHQAEGRLGGDRA